MSRWSGRFSKSTLILAACCLLPGCGLILAPVRVAGAVVDSAYVGGKKVAKSTSDRLEKRKLRKEKEEEELAKKNAKGKSASEPQAASGLPGTVPPLDSIPIDQSPAIPLDDQPIPPVEPLPLPQ